MLDGRPAVLLLIMAPVLLLFALQLYRSLERYAARPGGRTLDRRTVIMALLAAAAMLTALVMALLTHE